MNSNASPDKAVYLADNYHAECILNWKARNKLYHTVCHYFRRFTVKDGNAYATFQVAKDGACYEDMPLDVEELTVPGLRLWASVLRIPYASRKCRVELEELLQPVLSVLALLR